MAAPSPSTPTTPTGAASAAPPVDVAATAAPLLDAAATAAEARPASRLFVVQLGEGAGCRGRVEHVLSGRRQTFASSSELLAALGLTPRT